MRDDVLRYEVFSERKLGFLEAVKRAPTLTIRQGDNEFAKIVFETTTEFQVLGLESDLVGKSGKISVDRTSVWYVSLAELSGRLVAEGVNFPVFNVGTPSVVNIVGCEVYRWTFTSRNIRVCDLEGEIVARRSWNKDDDGRLCEIEIWTEVPEAAHERMILLLALFTVALPWYSLSTQSTKV